MQDKEFQNLDRRLQETRQLAEDNHELLEKIHGMLWRGRMFRFLYWIVIIGISIGAFYFLEPYADQVFDAYDGIQQQINAFPGINNSAS